MKILCVGETGVGKMGVGEMGQIIGESGVGKIGVGETGTNFSFMALPSMKIDIFHFT